MKEVWKEIAQHVDFKIASLTLLSIFVLFLLAVLLVLALSEREAQRYQDLTEAKLKIQTNVAA